MKAHKPVTGRDKKGNSRRGRTAKGKSTGAKGKKPGGRRLQGMSLRASAEEPSPYALTEDELRMWRPRKKPVTLRLDADVLAWFKSGGRGYQTRVNQALRRMMKLEIKELG